MTGEPVLYDPETDTLLVELRPWPAAAPAEVHEQVGGEDAEDGLVVHYGPDGLRTPSRSSTLRSARTWSRAPFRPFATPRASPTEPSPEHVSGFNLSAGRHGRYGDQGTPEGAPHGGRNPARRPERPLAPEVDWARVDATTEAEIAAQIAEDDAEAMRDATAHARRVRRGIARSSVR